MIVLTILVGPEAGATLTLQGNRIELGRGAECDLVLDDRSVSRRHCVIERQADNFVVIDLDSTNSTFLNDDLLTPHQAHIIQAKDELTLGQIRLSIERLEPEEGRTSLRSPLHLGTASLPTNDSDTIQRDKLVSPAVDSAPPMPLEDDQTRTSLRTPAALSLAARTVPGIPQAIFPLVLTILNGPETGRIYIPTDDSCSLGRESTCDIVLLDPKVSGIHATIQRDGERYCLSDHKSANGTFLHTRSQPIAQVNLTDGDVFILGQTQVRVGLSTTIDTQTESVDMNEATFFSGRAGVVGNSPPSPATEPGQAPSPHQEATQLTLQPEPGGADEDHTFLMPTAGVPPISLRVIEGPNSDETFSPRPGAARFTVGRGRVATFQLNDRGVSRIHFSIEATPSGFILIDTDSMNGTFVNQTTDRIEQIDLHDGDEIRVSKTRLQVTISDTPQEKTAFVSSPS